MRVILFFVFTLIFSQFAFASLTKEDLKQKFISKNEIGPLSLNRLEKIEEVLLETGQLELIDRLLTKLSLTTLSELSTVIHSCELSGDTLGLYERGSSQTYTQTLERNLDPHNLAVFWKEASILDAVNKSYQHHIENNGVFASLVISKWPIICIRPNQELGKALGIFIHESEHFLGDKEENFDPLNYESEKDFIAKELMSSGGEFRAYSEEAKYLSELSRLYDYKSRTDLIRNYNEFMDTGSSIKLENMILNDLGYYQSFVNQYRTQLINKLNYSIQELNQIYNNIDLYEMNLNISEKNLEINESNQAVFKNNMNYYQNIGDMNSYQLEKDNLEDAVKGVLQNKNEIKFYESILAKASELVENSRSYLEEVKIKFKLIKNSDGLVDEVTTN